jgi:hypothetical protein
MGSHWGPRLSLTRSERLVRGRKLGVQDDWEWIDDILRRFPALCGLKAHEQYQEHERDSEAQSSMLDLNTRHSPDEATDAYTTADVRRHGKDRGAGIHSAG